MTVKIIECESDERMEQRMNALLVEGWTIIHMNTCPANGRIRYTAVMQEPAAKAKK